MLVYNDSMDWGYILDFIYEAAYLLGVFGFFIFIAVWKGRQAIINLILGLYLALLITLEFPNYELIFGNLDSTTDAAAKLGFFGIITLLTTALFWRVMPEAFRENKFESFGRKLLLAVAATVLMMIFSFHVLPVTDFLSPGTPVQSLFAPEQYFFWWLLFPLLVLFMV